MNKCQFRPWLHSQFGLLSTEADQGFLHSSYCPNPGGHFIITVDIGQTVFKVTFKWAWVIGRRTCASLKDTYMVTQWCADWWNTCRSRWYDLGVDDCIGVEVEECVWACIGGEDWLGRVEITWHWCDTGLSTGELGTGLGEDASLIDKYWWDVDTGGSCNAHLGRSLGGLLSEKQPVLRSFFGTASDFLFLRSSTVLINLVSFLLRQGSVQNIKLAICLFICHNLFT